MIEHRGPISGVATDGRYIATAGYDNQIVLWSADTGDALHRCTHDHLVNMCTFAGGELFSCSSDHTARRWRLADMRLLTVYSDHDDDVEMCAPSHDVTRIATASRDHRVRVFDIAGGLVWTGVGHEADVISVAWTADDRRIITSGDDGTIRCWDACSGALLETVDLDGVETDTVVITSSGLVLAGNDDGEIVLIRRGNPRDDAGSAHEIVKVEAHSAGVKRLVYDGGTRVASMSYDRTLCIWELSGTTLDLHATHTIPVEVWPRSAAFLDDHTMVFGTFGTSYVTLDLGSRRWSLDRSKPTPGLNAVLTHGAETATVGDAGIVRLGDTETPMGSLCNFLTSWGDRIVTGGQTGELFDARTGDVLYQHHSPLNCAAELLPGQSGPLAVGAYTGETLFFDAHGDLVAAPTSVRVHDNAIKGLAGNGQHLFSVCADGAAAVLAIADPSRRLHLGDAHTRIANGVTALADGRFASVSRDRILRIFTVRDRDGALTIDVEEVTTPHTHSVKCVAAHSTRPIVATGSYNGLVAVYDVGSGEWTESTRASAAGISSLCADPIRDVFLASCYDGSVYEIGRTPPR